MYQKKNVIFAFLILTFYFFLLNNKSFPPIFFANAMINFHYGWKKITLCNCTIVSLSLHLLKGIWTASYLMYYD